MAIIRTVVVNAEGPQGRQGDQGPIGPQGPPGDITNVFPFSGSAVITGSLLISGSNLTVLGSATATSFTGSLFGTSSWASNSVLLNYTSSEVFATTGSNIFRGNQTISGSVYMGAPGTDSIYFSGSGPASRLVWNDTDGTLDLGLKGNNVTLQIGQELVQRVVNKTNANLLESEYKVVRIRRVDEGGTQGQRLAVVLAQANNDANSVDTLGVVTENIADNQEGFITTSGLVRNIDTTGNLQGETWRDGDVLYLSPTVAGQLTTTKPQAPQHTVIMGYVVYRHQNNGKIFVKVDNGYEIDELHNVRINTSSLAPGQLLVRSGSNDGGVWINTNQLTGSYFVTGSITATSFTGSLFGTASQATNATSASYALTASYALNSSTVDTSALVTTSSFNTFTSSIQIQVNSLTAATSSYITTAQTSSMTVLSASFAATTSLAPNYVLTSVTASMIVASSSFATTASFIQIAQTASYVLNAISSSFSSTANFAPNYLLIASTSSMLAPYVLSSLTASFIQSNQTGSFVLTSSFNSFTSSYNTGSFTGSFIGSLQGTSSWAISASQAITSSYSNISQTTSTITINSFGSDVESYLLMSNVLALPGVGIGGDSELTYNSLKNKLSVGSISATSLTGSLLGTSSWATNAITSSYIDPLFISASAASYGFGSGGGATTPTSSLLTTASFTSPNITFTKGDNTTFTVNIAPLTSSLVQSSQTSSMTVLSSSFAATATTASYITPNNALLSGLPYTVYANTAAISAPSNTSANTITTITIPSSSIRVGSMIRVNSLSSIGTIVAASFQCLTTQSGFIDTSGFFYDSAIRQSTLYQNIMIKVASTTTLKSFPTIRTVFQGPTTTAIITKTIPDITTNDINLYMNVQKGGSAYAFSQEILNVEVIY